ncbi:MAG: N-acetylmuramoyl-L-alanine amidase, partial [Luteimonas sp.]|nr:N-acetylmuramoyl-L-alanine amidase [Luteimonas sp.]
LRLRLRVDAGAAVARVHRPWCRAGGIGGASAARAAPAARTALSSAAGGPQGAATSLVQAVAANDEDEPVPNIHAIELAPKALDEDDNTVADSDVPRAIPQRNPMVELTPATSRIAHREIKIRVASDGQPANAFEGRKVTWTMAPLFVAPDATDPAFRGDWAQAAQGHRDRFEAASDFGAHGFARSRQEQATTTVDAEGNSAIRVNLPPIGFNAARISAQVEGMDQAAELMDLEVPAIVVVDPGHGGETKRGGSSANNATSHGDAAGNQTLEKDLTLLFGTRLRDRLYELRESETLQLQVVMTRDDDVNVGIAERAHVARDRGADIFFSIHFNGNDSASVHGPETLMEATTSGNVNHDEDRALATRIQGAVTATVPNAQQPGERGYRGVKEYTPPPSGVYRDRNLGNLAGRPQSRACLVELEFMTNAGAERDLISGERSSENQDAIVNAIADAIVEDLKSQPAP